MRCIFCHNDPILNVNPKTQARKTWIIYNSSNGKVPLRKHLNILKTFEEKIIVLWGKMKDNFPKRNQMFLLIPYLLFLLQKNLLRKIMCNKSNFWKIWFF
jgi:hypothetical protein